jgi:hypothetical protein
MNLRFTLCAIVAGAFAATASAQTQEDSGLIEGSNSNWVVRVTAAGGAGGQRFNIDKERGGAPLFNGFQVSVFDFNTTTTDTFLIRVHGEDPATPDEPLFPAAYTGTPLPIVNGQNIISVVPPVPAPTSGGGDYWVATEFQAAIGAGNDGGWNYFTRGHTNHATCSQDLPGPGILPANNPVVDRLLAFGNTASLTSYHRAWVYYAEPTHNPLSWGKATTVAATDQRNQQSIPAIDATKGLISAASGSYPDVTPGGTRGNRTLGDDIGFRVNSQSAANNLVLFFLSFAWSPVPIPFPGGGTFDLDVASFIFLSAGIANATGELNYELPNVVVAGLAGTGVNTYWGAIVIDLTGGPASSTPSGRIRL